MHRKPIFIFSLLFFFSIIFSCQQKLEQSSVPIREYSVQLEVLADGFEIPWSIEIINENEYLFTERMGGLFHYKNGIVNEILGLPESQTYFFDRYYGGTMDVSLHPQFNNNNTVYLAYVDPNYHTNLARFKLINDKVENFEIILNANEFSIGSRIAWEDNNHLFMTMGVGGAPKPDPGPQDILDPRGKIFRLMADGSIPEDNPVFSGMNIPSAVWSYGHRDPQGLFYDDENAILYANEHGPLGGDELNIINKGENYGWPLFSYGLNYDLTKVSDMTEEEAKKVTTLPLKYWTPDFRIAPSGLLLLKNSNFTDWNGSFLMGALAYQHIVRYNPKTDQTEIVVPNVGRVRDIAQLPSGDLLILLDKSSPSLWSKGRLVKLSPKKN